MSLLDKESVKRAEKFLKDFDQSLEVIVLKDTARTAQDAATALGCDVGAIVKSLLFKTEDSFILCLVSGDKRCSLTKLKKITNKKKYRKYWNKRSFLYKQSLELSSFIEIKAY
jgi:prolyl-tRNA editing enzyme YbaK/EbsC (Cys-tRNA(Pro) deacylase)